MTLQEFIMGIIAGGLSYPVARFLFAEVVPPDLSPRAKRIVVYLLSLALAVMALAAGSVFGYVALTPDTVFTAFVTAFSTSQALHAWLELGPGTSK